MKLRHFYIIALAVIIAAAFAVPYVFSPVKTDIPKEYTVYASFFPVYSVGKRICEGVPGIRLHQLTQPTDNDIAEYSLSDWDMSLLEHCDVLIMLGIESFSSYSNDSTIIISAMNTADTNSYSYVSLEGTRELARGICANMMSIDEKYSDVYLANLERFESEIDALQTGIDAKSFTRAFGITDSSFLSIMDELQLHDYHVFNTESVIADIAASDIEVLFCNNAFISKHEYELKNVDIELICLDNGTAHSESDTIEWLDILKNNMVAVNAALF